MLVDQNEPAGAVLEDAGENMHQAQVVEEMTEMSLCTDHMKQYNLYDVFGQQPSY